MTVTSVTLTLTSKRSARKTPDNLGVLERRFYGGILGIECDRMSGLLGKPESALSPADGVSIHTADERSFGRCDHGVITENPTQGDIRRYGASRPNHENSY